MSLQFLFDACFLGRGEGNFEWIVLELHVLYSRISSIRKTLGDNAGGDPGYSKQEPRSRKLLCFALLCDAYVIRNYLAFFPDYHFRYHAS